MAALLAACEPAGVTEAREQLGRGDEREVTYRIPVAQETYGALRFLTGVATRILEGQLVGVELSSDSLRILIGRLLAAAGEADLEGVEEVERRGIDFDELTSAVRASTVHRAFLEIAVRHTSAAELVTQDARVGLVRLDESGAPIRTASGELALETDASGAPLEVDLAPPGSDTLHLPSGETREVRREAAPLVDRLVDLALEGARVGVATRGSVRVAAGDAGEVQERDRLIVRFRPVVGLDLTIPDSGVVVRRDELGEGLGLSPADADQVADRVLSAGGRFFVGNGVPFVVEVNVAYVGDDRLSGDVFRDPDRVSLDTLRVRAGTLGPGGRVQRSRADTLGVALTGQEIRPLLEDVFTAAVRIRLRPARGTGGRGAFRADEVLAVDVEAMATVRAGGGG